MSEPAAPTELQRLREQYRLARARARVAQAESEAATWQGMLSEGMADFAPGWSDLADPFAVRRDDFGQIWLPLGAGTMFGRQNGRNRPFAWTDFDLDRQRSLARWLATKNDLAIGALRALRNFTVKKGYKWEARPAKGQEKNPDAVQLAAMVQRLIDQHSDFNNLASRERSSLTRSVRDGEVFTRHFCQDDGTTIVRFVEPEQVREKAGLDENCAFGIETEPGDVESPLAYWISYDGTEWDRVDAGEVSHLKRNVDECVKRGLSDFFSSGDGLDGVNKLLRNMREAGAVQAAIAWIEQFDSSSSSQVSAHVAGVKDLNRPQIQRPEVGRNVDYQKFEPGTIVKVGKGKTYMPAPMAGNTVNHTTIVQACLRALGCRWNMPEYLISGDSSNANYASTLVSGSPFVNSIECEQDDYGRFFLRWRWIAVRNACEYGLIPARLSDVMALVDIHYTAPQVAVANKSEEAEVDHKDIAAGVMSIQTRRGRVGLDDDQERANLKQEPLTRVGGKVTDVDQQGDPVKPGQAPGDDQQQESVQESEDADEVDPETVAEIFYGLYGEDALEIVRRLAGVTEGWIASSHPRGKGGKFITKGSGEAVQAAKDVVSRVVSGDASADPKELLDHLSILTVQQIRDIGKAHGKKIPKMLREDLVSAVAQLVGGKAEKKAEKETGKDAGGKKPQPKPPAKPAPTPPSEHGYQFHPHVAEAHAKMVALHAQREAHQKSLADLERKKSDLYQANSEGRITSRKLGDELPKLVRQADAARQAMDGASSVARQALIEHMRGDSSLTVKEGGKLSSGVRAVAGKGAAFASSLLGGKVSLPVEFVENGPLTQNRSYYEATANHVSLTSHANESTAVHEVGHWIENNVPGVRDAVREFLDKRVGNEQPVSMAKLFPKNGYDSHEMGRKDNFDRVFGSSSGAYYAGKVYAGGDTEILSMGIEEMHRDPAGFAVKDPEYFQFVASVLHGSGRKGGGLPRGIDLDIED